VLPSQPIWEDWLVTELLSMEVTTRHTAHTTHDTQARAQFALSQTIARRRTSRGRRGSASRSTRARPRAAVPWA
jgi:hypothetical protein